MVSRYNSVRVIVHVLYVSVVLQVLDRGTYSWKIARNNK